MWVNIQRITRAHHCANVVWPDLEQTGDGIDQDTKERLAQLTAGLAQRHRPLQPPVACVTGGAMGALTPKSCGEEGSGLGRQVTVKLASMKQESNININGK